MAEPRLKNLTLPLHTVTEIDSLLPPAYRIGIAVLSRGSMESEKSKEEGDGYELEQLV